MFIMTEKDETIYFDNFKVITPEIHEDVNNKRIVATILKNIETYGYTMSSNLIDRLVKCTEEDLNNFYAKVMKLIRSQIGVVVMQSIKPLYQNFPNELIDEDETDDYLLTINGYVENHKNYNGNQIRLSHAFPLFKTFPDKIIELGSIEDYIQYYANILNAKSSISSINQTYLKYFIKTADIDTIKSIIPETFTSKEVLSIFAFNILTEKIKYKDLVIPHFKTATDILRLASLLSGYDSSLTEKIKFAKFKRPIRKILMEMLNNCNKYSLAEDMNRNKMLWISLGNILHPGEFKKFKNANYAFDKIRNSKVETFNSKFEKAFNEDDINTVLSLLLQRPGEYARRLARVIRKFDDNRVIYGFGTVANKVSSQVLLQVRQYFINQKEPSETRVFYPMGGISRAYGIDNTQEPIPEDKIDTIINICEEALINIYKDREPLGKVYVSPEMVNFVVPMSQRSASKTLLSVAKGSRFQIDPAAKIIRTFLYWKQDKNSYGVDLDLSAVLYNEDLEFVTDIAYYNTEDSSIGCHHSGDVREAPNGASEYIDLDIVKLREKGIRYIASTVNSYSSEKFCDLPQCFMGIMVRSGDQGELYDPTTVVNKSDISVAATQCLSTLIDLETMEMIWIDMVIKDNCQFCSSQSKNRNTTYLTLKNVLSTSKANIYDLAVLNAKARGELVDNPEDADIIVSMDGTLKPYNAEEIIANWI